MNVQLLIQKVTESFNNMKNNGTFSNLPANRTIFFWIDWELDRRGDTLANLGYEYHAKRLRLFAEVRPLFDAYYEEALPADKIQRLAATPLSLENFTLLDAGKVWLDTFGENAAALIGTNAGVLYFIIKNAWWLLPTGAFIYFKSKK
jgi:hypothetical protein